MVNYINHKSANDGDGPNVRIQWPTEELIAHKPEWLQKDINFLRDTIDKIGLSFDYVALRDIKEGEEIFMDYGDEWVSRVGKRSGVQNQNFIGMLKRLTSSLRPCVGSRSGGGMGKACKRVGTAGK